MPSKISAGLLMYYYKGKNLKIFLVHPGGPFFAKKDEGYWGIPKGLVNEGEDLLDAAKREFEEETGIKPSGEFFELGSITQKGGKVVYAWAFSCDSDIIKEIKCNTFEIEWPPKSGKTENFPEVDRGEFFSEETARKKIYSFQEILIDRLKNYLNTKVGI
jgi:predicted NUDIX family NTP pyrophosphohydrolase